MSGLVGDVNIPRQATGATAAWIGTEGNAATESEATFNQLQLSPKDLGVFTDVTRRLILQSDPSVEQIVREDLAQSIANGVDDAALNGTGTSGQPTGVRNTSGIGDVNLGANGGAITWGDVLEFWSDVGTANALMGRLAWIMNHQTAAKLMQVERATNTAVFLLDPERMTMVLAPVFLTELAPSNLSKGTGTNLDAIFFGNWSDLILAEWGVLDLLRDPFTASSSGTVRFRVFMTVDIGVRHAGSFSITDEFDPAA